MLQLQRQQEALGRELIDALLEPVYEASYLSSEPVTPFERDLARYCGRPYAVGVGSGTSALHLSLLAAGVGGGDEVVTVPNSFFATAEAILQVGARPVFIDIDPASHLLDVERLKEAITSATRAILPVHLYGNVANVQAIARLLEALGRQDIRIIEDCAHAIGARRAGNPVPLGTIGAFSFNPVKNLGALGDAGAVVTSDAAVAERVRLLRDHGRADKNTHLLVGFNSRLRRIDDRVLSLKLDRLDEWNETRRSIARRYDEAFDGLPGVTCLAVPPEVESAHHQYVLGVRARDRFRRRLAERGISTAVHYPRLLPEQPALGELGCRPDRLSVAGRTNRRIVSLPCYPELREAEVERVIVEVRDAIRAIVDDEATQGGE